MELPETVSAGRLGDSDERTAGSGRSAPRRDRRRGGCGLFHFPRAGGRGPAVLDGDRSGRDLAGRRGLARRRLLPAGGGRRHPPGNGRQRSRDRDHPGAPSGYVAEFHFALRGPAPAGRYLAYRGRLRVSRGVPVPGDAGGFEQTRASAGGTKNCASRSKPPAATRSRWSATNSAATWNSPKPRPADSTQARLGQGAPASGRHRGPEGREAVRS